jgi:dihydrofolate reductase
MIRFIVAIDENRGLANEHGIPWQGKLPTDIRDFREKTMNSIVLMGYGTYVEFKTPLPKRHNVVASSKAEQLREGFELINNARRFLRDATEDIWVIGGAGLFTQTLDMADELYITQLDGDFSCTKFFPAFKDRFGLKSHSQPITENGITFRFEIWQQKQ